MAGFKWDVPPAVAWPTMAEAYHNAIERGVYAIAQKWQPQISNWMKQNASWTDRTANARQSLHVDLEHQIGIMVEIILAHGVEYGAYLEGRDPRFNFAPTRQGERYAIINPAIDHFAPQIWADVVRMLS